MIARTHRFHGYNSLRHVYSRGQTVRGPLVSLKYGLNPRRSSYRAAIVVSRKVHKSAVVRNRIRRRIYEIIRERAPYMSQAYDLVFTVFSDQLAVLPTDELQQAISGQLVKAKVITVLPRPIGRGEDGCSHGIVDTKEPR